MTAIVVLYMDIRYNDNNGIFKTTQQCLFLPPVAPYVGLDGTASVTPFVGPDGSSRHYSERFLHLGAATTQG